MLVSDVTRGTGEVDKAAAALVTKRGTRRSGPARMSEGEGEVRVREKVRDGLCVVVAVAVEFVRRRQREIGPQEERGRIFALRRRESRVEERWEKRR